MKVLELFAGSRSIGQAAESLGYTVCSVDINDFKGIDIVKDIEFLTVDDLPFKPDIIWASPPCTTYSIAAVDHHRKDGKTISEFAAKSDRLVKNTLKIIHSLDAIYYIENPRGMLRKMDFMRGLNRTTVTYCSYNDNRMKPTDIWSNNIYDMFNLEGWQPKGLCFNGNTKCNHEAAPRGSRTGTQGIKGNYSRSKIPKELCLDILKTTAKKLNK